MPTLRYLLFILFFCCSPMFVIAQTATLVGQITDDKQFSLGQVIISLQNTNFRTQTDKEGKYKINKIPCGNYTLMAFMVGKKTLQQEISLTQETREINLQLEDLTTELSTATVEAQREQSFGLTQLKGVENFGIYKGKKTEVIELKDLTANAATNNARQVFSKITGLNIWESDQAGLQLGIGGRGLSPNRTANFNTRQNGYDISADALGYPESYYTPPIEASDRIEVVRGAASLQYGTQFGGMLNFRFKKGSMEKKAEFTTRQTGGSWGYLGSFNSLGGTVANGKLNYYTFFQYKRADGYRPNSRFDAYNGFVSLDYKLTEKLKINAEYTIMEYLAKQAGGLTDRNFEQNPRQSFRSRNWFKVDWNLFALTGTYRFSDNTQLNIRNFGIIARRQSLGNLERINVVDFGGNRTLIDGQFENIGNETRLLHGYTLGKQRQTLLAGVRLYKGFSTARQGDADKGSDANFKYLNPNDVENSDYSFPNRNYSVFMENIFNITEKLSLTPGVRYENIQTFSEGYYKNRVFDGAGNLVTENKVQEKQERKRSFVIFGLGAAYKANERTEFYANFSQNYKAINFTDLRIQNPNFIVDPNIQDEKGYTADLGVRGKCQNKFNYEITAFLIRYNGKIGQVLRADQPPLFLDYRFRGNISDARNVGIETFGEYAIIAKKDQKWTIFANIAYVDARYINTEDNSIKNKKVEMVPPLTLRSGTTFQYKTFRSTLQFAYSAEHFSDATNARRTATAVEGLIPSYKVMDLSMSYSLPKYPRLTLEGSINNLLNEAYFTRRAESYPGPGIIPADGRGFYCTLQWKI